MLRVTAAAETEIDIDLVKQKTKKKTFFLVCHSL